MNEAQRIGESYILMNDVVGIERGEWNDAAQDWLAIAVMKGNTRIPLKISCYGLKQIVERQREWEEYKHSSTGGGLPLPRQRYEFKAGNRCFVQSNDKFYGLLGTVMDTCTAGDGNVWMQIDGNTELTRVSQKNLYPG